MQFAKDSFFVALRDRLAALNPARTISLDGQTRPAVVALENEPVTAADPAAIVDPQTLTSLRRPRVANAYYITWGAARVVAQTGAQPMVALECSIGFAARGDESGAGQERGRRFGELMEELLQILFPARTDKFDYTGAAPTTLGSTIFWTPPRFSAPQIAASEVRGSAAVTLFFSPEASS
jgi:hypothetical protein